MTDTSLTTYTETPTVGLMLGRRAAPIDIHLTHNPFERDVAGVFRRHGIENIKSVLLDAFGEHIAGGDLVGAVKRAKFGPGRGKENPDFWVKEFIWEMEMGGLVESVEHITGRHHMRSLRVDGLKGATHQISYTGLIALRRIITNPSPSQVLNAVFALAKMIDAGMAPTSEGRWCSTPMSAVSQDGLVCLPKEEIAYAMAASVNWGEGDSTHRASLDVVFDGVRFMFSRPVDAPNSDTVSLMVQFPVVEQFNRMHESWFTLVGPMTKAPVIVFLLPLPWVMTYEAMAEQRKAFEMARMSLVMARPWALANSDLSEETSHG